MEDKKLICLRGIFFDIDKLYKCRHWSDENNECKGVYDKTLLFNLNDIFRDCKGFCNEMICPYFNSKPFSQSDIKRLREYIRKNISSIEMVIV